MNKGITDWLKALFILHSDAEALFKLHYNTPANLTPITAIRLLISLLVIALLWHQKRILDFLLVRRKENV